MPPVIIAAFAAAGITISVVAANVIFVVASYAIQTAMANRARRGAEAAQRAANDAQRASYNSGLVDRTTVVRTAVQPRNIILGRDEASGPLACWFTYGPKRNLHAFAVVLAGHECDAVEQIMFNHEAVTLDANGGVTAPAKWVRTTSSTVTENFSSGPPGTVVTLSQAPTRLDAVVDSFAMPAAYIQAGAVITLTNETRTVDDNTGAFIPGTVSVTYTVVRNEPLFTVRTYLGAPGQAAAPELIAAAAAAGVPASWDATRRGNGICYVSVQVDADFNILGQIGIPNVSAVVRGVKALDPRTGLTAWTQNPAILARWFITDSGFSPQCAATRLLAPGRWNVAPAEVVRVTQPASASYRTSAASASLVFAAPNTPRFEVGALLTRAATNLLPQSQAFDLAPWAFVGTGSVVANSTLAPDGTLTADELIDSDTVNYVYWDNVVAVANDSITRTASVYLRQGTAASSTLVVYIIGGAPSLGGGYYVDITWSNLAVTTNAGGTATPVGSGWYRLQVSVANNASGNTSFYTRVAPAGILSGGAPVGSVFAWGAQLEEGAAATAYIATAAAPVTRPATYEPAQLLVEAAATNLLIRSDNFADVAWSQSGVAATANTTLAPDGTLTADTLTNSVATDGFVGQQVSTALDVVHSIFVKTGGANPSAAVQLRLITFATLLQDDPIYFNFSTRVFAGGLALVNGFGYQELSDGWFRIWASNAAAAGQTAVQLRTRPVNAAGGAVAGETIIVWGAQIEIGLNLSNYIPTTSAPVTRAADIVQVSDEINTAELVASVNVCAEAIFFAAGRLDTRYSCNGQLTSAAAPMDNLNHILDAMDGDAVWISGQWQLVAGYYKTPTLTINEDTLSSAGITVVPRTAKRDLFNGVKGTFVNAYAGYVRSSYPLVTSTVYQAQDGGEMLPHDVNFELVNDPTRCQMIAWQRLTRARQPLTLQLGTTLKGYDGAPLQTVNVNLRRPGYVNKVFSILRREFDGNKLQYILQETGPAVWQWDYTQANQAVDLPNTSFPVLGALPILQNVSTSSGTADLLQLGDGTIASRVRVRWALVQDIYVTNGGKIEWQHKVANAPGDVWQSLPLADGTDVEIFTGALKDGQLLLLRGRCVSALGRRGDWCPLVSVTVIGKTEPPPNVKTFAVQGKLLSWSPVVALDLAGYQVRFNYGQNTDWGTGTPLQAGLITASPWLPDILPPGQITLMIKAVDTSGNQSALAASILFNLGDVIVANLILTYDDKAAGFPGTPINSAVVAGNLLANDSGDLFWGPDNANFWFGADTDLFWPTATYLQLAYTTAYTVTALQAGVRLTLLGSIVGASYTIEYRYDTSGMAWGAGNDFFWGADAALYWTAPTAWRTWPGAIDNIAEGRIEFRVVIQPGEVRGAINTLTLQFDVVDEFEEINNVAVSALGTRLALVNKYRSVNNVQLTLQADGGSAINARTVDKLATGPLVICVNSAGAQVAGILDARVQGVKG